MRRTASGLGPGVFLMAFLPTLAWAAGNAQTGKEVAERWCASCHLVNAEQTQGSADAPSFMSIAEQSGEELEWLKAFLVEPHPPMPEMSLTRQEIQDLIAYLDALGK